MVKSLRILIQFNSNFISSFFGGRGGGEAGDVSPTMNYYHLVHSGPCPNRCQFFFHDFIPLRHVK